MAWMCHTGHMSKKRQQDMIAWLKNKNPRKYNNKTVMAVEKYIGLDSYENALNWQVWINV